MRIFTQLWKKQYLLLAFVLICSVMPAIADDNNLITQQITVNLKKPGTLSSLIGDDDKYRIVNLKITGYINCDDFVFIRDMAGLASVGKPHKRDSEIIGYDYKTVETPGKLQYLDIQNTTWRASAYSSFIIKGCFCPDPYPSDQIKAIPAMGDCVFHSLSNLRKIVLPNWMPIGGGLFAHCNSLTSANIPEGVTRIANGAFWDCRSLTSVNIPEGVTSIGLSAFEDCRSLTSVNIPEGVTSIGEEAFYNCSSLTSVNIPEGVTSIDWSAFYNCSSLTSVNIPGSLKEINAYLFKNCTSLTDVYISEGVTSIWGGAFSGCAISNIRIPNSVTNIGHNVFENCTNLYSISLSSQMTSIESETFAGCKNLRSLNIPSSITRIEADFCKGSAIKYLYFDNPSTPPSLKGDVTWKDYSRFIVIVPDGSYDTYFYSDWVFSIRERGDIITKTKKIHIDQAGTLRDILDPDTAGKLTEVVITGELNLNDFLYLREAAGCLFIVGEDVYSFDGVLQNIDLSNAKLIDDGNFSYDFVGMVEEKDRAGYYYLKEEASIGDNGKSFQGLFACLYGLDTVRLPRNLTTIGRYAFYDDSNLFTVEIPESVTEIDSYAFACPNLINIYCHGATPANIADETVFSEIDKDQCTLYVPEGSVEAYRTATYWKDFKNIKEKYYSSTGINKVNTNSGSQKEVHEISRYSINGQRLNAPTRGINIVKYSDGTTKKIMVP